MPAKTEYCAKASPDASGDLISIVRGGTGCFTTVDRLYDVEEAL